MPIVHLFLNVHLRTDERTKVIIILAIVGGMAKEVNASHILVSTEKKALDVREMIYGGEKFGDMAKKYSSCPSGKKGGDLGWFSRGMMVKPFEDAAFSADKGAVVGPVRTEFGWHLIYVKDVK
jgi:Parvulin-like peptidyl-prolyl isomerase